jgi:transglutaminase-like putative cysteine protease
MAKYEGDNPKIKIQITKTGGSTYTYDVHPGEPFVSFPLSEGSGSYSVAMFVNIEGDKYHQVCAQEIQEELQDEYSPFLRPNQFSNFTSSTRAVAKASELAQGCKSDLKVVEELFLYVTENVVYDHDKAKTVHSGYLPDIDDTLTSGKGICFDYASLMTCMLRTQRIPCKLVVGYTEGFANDAYHAWISVHVDGIGWVANMIQFNDDQWTLMDPTLAAAGDMADPNVIGDGEDYIPVHYY